MSATLRAKLDPQSRLLFARGQLSGPFEALLRVARPFDPARRSALAAAGCRIRTAAGVTVSGAIADLAALERVATLDFVETIELSRPLYPED